MSNSAIPWFKLSDGNKIPAIGLGTWECQGETLKQAIKHSIKAGYRMLDTAHGYLNEEDIGQALHDVFSNYAEYGVKREDFCIMTKLWMTFMRKDLVRPAVLAHLKRLQVSYLDVLLIHWPTTLQDGATELYPAMPDGKIIYSDVDFLETWAEFEKAKKDGLIRSIGVSNFSESQLKKLLAVCEIRPVINEVEMSPYLTIEKHAAFLAKEQIVPVAYSQFARPDLPTEIPANYSSPLEDASILAIAARHKKSAAQVILRWLSQRGAVLIPRSVTAARIAENANIFDFQLTEEEMRTMAGLDRGMRMVHHTAIKGHFNYPFANNSEW